MGPKYHIYFTEECQCYARDCIDSFHKIPLFSPSDISLLFDYAGLETKGLDLWVVSRIQVSADLSHFAILLIHPHFEVGPIFFLKRTTQKEEKQLQLSGGLTSILYFSEKAFNLVLGKNSQGETLLLYTVPNAQLRPYAVVLVSDGGAKAHQIHSEESSDNFIDIGLTRDQRLATINSNSLTTSEIHLFDLDKMTSKLFHSATAGVECFVDHIPGKFIVLSNHAAQNSTYGLYLVPDEASTSHWSKVSISLDLQCGTITDVEIFADYALIYSTDDQAVYKLHVYRWKEKTLSAVTGLPDICTIKPAGITQDLTSHCSWARISTPIHPPDLYAIDLAASRLKTPFLKPSDFSGGYLPLVAVKRIWTCGSHTKVPITYISQARSNKPLLLVAYGAYGVNADPEFKEAYLPLIRRGWEVAIVHIRGGSELGPAWYTRERQDSVDDVLAAAHRFGTRTKAILGISAGAVAVAGAVHREPDRFKAMILRVPFLDVVGSMLDPTAPLTKVEYLEWGNISDSAIAYRKLLTLSPYETIPCVQTPPAIMISAGGQDQRTDPSATLRYIARWRKMLHDQGLSDWEVHSRLLINMDMAMGHRSIDSHQYYASVSQELSFLLEHCP
ncbi:hypothetical protein DSO57_1007427 [Entomophthora muscae]|uniref:Uncharacterized protein n=1 Tax=Entomophthora muscae TaxID=34485 RepID=A0ACC2T7Q4_9FUNG|nr:hypothetical protein DSO57_1007427 [Entomophthora muscae]